MEGRVFLPQLRQGKVAMKNKVVVAAVCIAVSTCLIGCTPSEEKVEQAVSEISSGTSWEEMSDTFDKYREYMTENQVEECDSAIENQKLEELKVQGEQAALDYCIDYVKTHLKSPDSFNMYSSSSECGFEFSELGEDIYLYDVEFTYGATNSFGGEVTSEAEFSVNVELDMESMTATAVDMFMVVKM